MKKILNKNLEEILKSRVAIARDTFIFKIGAIAEEWEISKATLHRYDSEKYREASVFYEKKSRYLREKIDTSVCYKCHVKVLEHNRCRNCSILLHGEYPYEGLYKGCIGTHDIL